MSDDEFLLQRFYTCPDLPEITEWLTSAWRQHAITGDSIDEILGIRSASPGEPTQWRLFHMGLRRSCLKIMMDLAGGDTPEAARAVLEQIADPQTPLAKEFVGVSLRLRLSPPSTTKALLALYRKEL